MIQPYWQGGEYVKEKDKKAIQTDWKQSGNIMLITAVLLLIVAVVVVTCIRISKMQIEFYCYIVDNPLDFSRGYVFGRIKFFLKQF